RIPFPSDPCSAERSGPSQKGREHNVKRAFLFPSSHPQLYDPAYIPASSKTRAGSEIPASFLVFHRNRRSPMVPMDRSSVRGQKGLRFGGLVLPAPAAALVAAPPAQAAFHFMVIQEVFVGPPSDGILRPVPLTA